MNAIMNQTQLWYCDICDKRIIIKSKSKHINSKAHTNKKEYGTVVEKHEFNNPDIDEVNYILNDTIKSVEMNIFNLLNFDVFMIAILKF